MFWYAMLFWYVHQWNINVSRICISFQVLFAIGTCLVVASSVWLVLIPEGVSSQYMVLIPAFLGGTASTTMLVQSSTFVADLIGSHIVSSLPVLISSGHFRLSCIYFRVSCGPLTFEQFLTWKVIGFPFSVKKANKPYLTKVLSWVAKSWHDPTKMILNGLQPVSANPGGILPEFGRKWRIIEKL